MSIQLIARDLYKLIQAVEKLEKEILNTSPEKQEALKDELRKLRAQRDYMRRVLDGRKEG